MIFQMGLKMNECSTSVILNHEGWAEISFFIMKDIEICMSVNLLFGYLIGREI